MNITHAVEEKIEGDRLKAIFNRQKELMDKYHDIEKRSGLLQTEDCPINLDDKKGQARIKDFSWRIIEEVGEALDAYYARDDVHFVEELIDGLHFLTELTILSGFDLCEKYKVKEGEINTDGLDILFVEGKHRRITKGDIRITQDVTELVMQLGMMCNCLKNKPWKQTNMLTDKENFYKHLEEVWKVYFSLLSVKMFANDIVNVYMKKSQVNKFRQRSNY